jgi:acyl-CoA dehydrogenase
MARAMDLTLHSEQQMMIDAARKLIREMVIGPRIDIALDQSGEFPHSIFQSLWENGMLHLEFPESLGGPGLSCLDHVLVQEEVHYGCLGIGTSVMGNSLAAMPLIVAGHDALMKKYLAPLLDAPSYAAYCCSEPDAGSDVAALSTRYIRRGDVYVLNGQKRWITNGDVARWYLVFAREEGSRGHKGIAAFVVEADWPGVRWDALVHKMGQRASHTTDVLFENVAVPAANLVVGPEAGFKLAMATFDRSRPWIAAAASGVIRRARDESLRYAMERKTFGVPILEHQMVGQMVADMEIAYTATRLMTWNAAQAIDRGELRGTHTACAKAFGADAAMRVTTDAVQVFGGYGYTNEFVVEKLMRDAKLLQIYEGTSQIQRLVIARDMARAC